MLTAPLSPAVPGVHKGAAAEEWGHTRLRDALASGKPFPPAFARAPLAVQVRGPA